jgi:hypothetical protein
MEAQSAGLHDHLTSILSIYGRGDTGKHWEFFTTKKLQMFEQEVGNASPEIPENQGFNFETEEKLEVMSICMGIIYRDKTNITEIPWGNGGWTYVHWVFFCSCEQL